MTLLTDQQLHVHHMVSLQENLSLGFEVSDQDSIQSAQIQKRARILKHCKNRQNKDLNDRWKLNEGRKYCRMLPLQNAPLAPRGAFCNTFDLH